MGKSLQGKELGKGISQRADGQYMARFTDRFGKRKCIYSDNLKEIKSKLEDAKYEDKKRMNLSDDTIKLNEWFEKWLSIHKYNTIRPNTKRHYTQIYKKHIAPTLGNRKLCDINQIMIKEIINNLAKNGYQYETQNKVKILMLDMFDKAIIDDFAKKNPARGIKIKRSEEAEKIVKALTNEEQQIFFDCCKGTFYDNLFTVAIHTGLRPGELCALEETDIDFKKNEISVTKTLLYQKLEGDEKKEFHFESPKTKQSKRKIPIDKTCVIALKKQIIQSKAVKAKSVKFKDVPKEFQNLLFTTKFGTPINSQIYGDAIGSIVDEINVMRDPLEAFEKFNPHTFRHTFSTRCFEAGISPKTVQTYLGHASLQMTMDLYTSVLEPKKHEDMDKFEEFMEEMVNACEEKMEDAINQKFRETKENNKVVCFAVAN